MAFDRFKPGVTMETIRPYLKEEVVNVWRLWKTGIVRENYARADEPGAIIVFEVESVDEARRYVVDFPLSRAGYLEWQYLPLQAPLPLESLMDPSVDVAGPYDRTSRTTCACRKPHPCRKRLSSHLLTWAPLKLSGSGGRR